MFESSLVVGNTFIYIVFNGEKYIDGEFTDFAVLKTVYCSNLEVTHFSFNRYKRLIVLPVPQKFN